MGRVPGTGQARIAIPDVSPCQVVKRRKGPELWRKKM